MNNTTDNLYSNGRQYYWYFVFVVDSILFLPTVFGNCLILCTVYRFPNLKTRINGLIANLALSDLFVGILFYPYEMTYILVPSMETQKVTCLLRHSFFASFIGASIMNLFIISLDRYFSISYPLKYHTKVSTKRLIRYCIAGWTTAIVLGTLPLFGWNVWSPGKPCHSKLVLDEGYVSLILTIYITIIVISTVLYILLVKKVFKRLKQQSKGGPTERINFRSSVYSRNVLKTKMMIFVFGVFAVCWLPYSCLVILRTYFITPNSEMEIVERYFSCLGVTNSALNWIIYGVKNQTMRTAFRRTLCCNIYQKVQLTKTNSEDSTSVNLFIVNN